LLSLKRERQFAHTEPDGEDGAVVAGTSEAEPVCATGVAGTSAVTSAGGATAGG
jgi:hypothetical protein